MKITRIFLALLPNALARPLTVPVASNTALASREFKGTYAVDLFPTEYKKDLISAPETRQDIPVPAEYAQDVSSDTQKRDDTAPPIRLFATEYKKDVINGPHRRAAPVSQGFQLFATEYKKDLIQ